jgi:hypothetical protein
MQSPLDNNTFFSNESHATCLFRSHSFMLNGLGGGDAGAASFQIGDINIPGSKYIHPMLPKQVVDKANRNALRNSLCVFPNDVDKGGLTLGEIRELSRMLIDDCSICGRPTLKE